MSTRGDGHLWGYFIDDEEIKRKTGRVENLIYHFGRFKGNFGSFPGPSLGRQAIFRHEQAGLASGKANGAGDGLVLASQA